MFQSRVLYLSIAIFQVILGDSPDTDPNLTNEIASDCSNCVPSCNTVTVDNSTCKCVPGFVCKPGYLRNSQGTCVPIEECDPPCGGDFSKVLDLCGDITPETCDSIDEGIRSCSGIPNCKCMKDLVLNRGGECVRRENCEKTCPINEVYSESKGDSGCENTCLEPHRRITCPHPQCIPGCTCIENFVRDNNGVCIAPDLCTVSCGGDVNAKIQDCYSACEEKHGDVCYGMFLDHFCNNFPTDVCGCKPGYVSRQGVCIPVKDYPTCDCPDEIFACRQCEITCVNMNLTCGEISSNCIEGCYCKKGYARNPEGECIKISNCYQTSENVCGLNEILDNSASECIPEDLTCAMHFLGEECICIQLDLPNPRCRCIPGFVRNSNGVCVSPGECYEDFNIEHIIIPSIPCEGSSNSDNTESIQPST